MAAGFWITKALARSLYFVSGFAFFGGLGFALFSSDKRAGMYTAAAGLLMWFVARLLVPLTLFFFHRMDGEAQDRADPYGELRASPWGGF